MRCNIKLLNELTKESSKVQVFLSAYSLTEMFEIGIINLQLSTLENYLFTMNGQTPAKFVKER